MKAQVVPLKKVCSQAGVDPRTARRVLRSKRKRSGGRWAWSASKALAIVTFLKKEAANGKA